MSPLLNVSVSAIWCHVSRDTHVICELSISKRCRKAFTLLVGSAVVDVVDVAAIDEFVVAVVVVACGCNSTKCVLCIRSC